MKMIIGELTVIKNTNEIINDKMFSWVRRVKTQGAQEAILDANKEKTKSSVC